MLGRLKAILGSSWGDLRPSRGVLGRRGGVLGASLAVPEASCRVLEPFGRRLDAAECIWGALVKTPWGVSSQF